MAEAPKVPIIRPSSANTPPNCAICLGSCTNKCFSDSCMHQFCFQCLLEWSRIKAECPLCKQPFKTIIHNVLSNEDYDEHVVETPRNEEVRFLGNDDMWFLPLPLTPHRHEFHVRTTFTVDSRGEHAIQQMLLAHPLTNGRITVNAGLPSTRTLNPSRHRRDYSATSFRRSIYQQNLWVNALPDLTGRYRECSPIYFRNNPSARQRLVPWLNRELNALTYENTQLILHLVDLILDHLLRYHICSRTFRNLLREYLNTKTDQFIHEFYCFMRSPYDMIGYDRNVIYTSRPQSPAPILEDDTVEIPDDNSNDSDVVLVGETNPANPVTISLIDSNSDSDELILISSGSQVPMPLQDPGPDLRTATPPELPARSSSPVNVSNLPPKLRYKHLCVEEKEKHRRMKKRQHRRSSISSSSSSSTEVDEREKESYKKYKRRKLLKKLKKIKHKTYIDSSSSTEVNITSQSDTNENDQPLINVTKKYKKTKKSKKDKKRRSSRYEDYVEQSRIDNTTQIFPMDLSTPSCSRFPTFPSTSSTSSSLSNNSGGCHIELPKTRSTVELSNNGEYASVQFDTLSSGLADKYEPSSSTTKIVRNKLNSPPPPRERSRSRTKSVGTISPFPSKERDHEESGSSGSSTEPYRKPLVKSEIREIKYDSPGPSTSKPMPLVLRRDRNKWYVFGDSDSSD